MKIKHFIKVHFDRRKPELDQQWFDERYDFFERYTLRSLEAQTFKDWDLWLSFGCGMDEISCKGLHLGAMNHHARTGRMVHFTFRNDHDPTPHLREQIGDCDYVYITRVDSDDLYSPDALQIVHDTLPQELGRTEASMFRRGYLHDVRTGETGTYHGSSTPFHTMMVPREVFCDPVRYKALDYGDHSLVNSCYPTTVLPDWRFAVLVHGRNFISDMSYGRERIFGVDRDWSVEGFLRQPVTFDVDDFCDVWNCLPALDRLKEVYKDFRCTLFTIPAKTSKAMILEALKRDWIELAWHGITHEPNEELKSPNRDSWLFKKMIEADLLWAKEYFVKGFRPPGWYITAEHVRVLNELGMWVALHRRDERTLGPLCEHGFYVNDDRLNCHLHTSGEGQKAHSVCGNGIDECLPELLTRWPQDQKFAFVSESVRVIK